MIRLLFIAAAIVAISIQFVGGRANAQAPAQQDTDNAICLMLESAARANDVPVEFFVRLIWQESRFKSDAVGPLTRSGAQAQGIAQFMSGTAAERSLLDPFDPIQALTKAAEFLRELHGRFGNLGLAAAADNAGPRRVAEWLAGTGQMPAETRHYVVTITGRSVEEWAAAGRADLPPTSVSCDRLTALMKQKPTPFLLALSNRVGEETGLPWGVQLAAGFSKTDALEKYAQALKRVPDTVANRDPLISSVVWRSRGPRPFYQVRIGAGSRLEADALCKRIRAAAGACMVLRNHNQNG